MKIRYENLKAYLDEQYGAAQKIADALGVSKGLISHWKKGKEPVPEEYTEKICEILGRPVEDLTKPFSGLILEKNSPQDMYLWELLQRFSQEGKDELIQIMLQRQKEWIK